MASGGGDSSPPRPPHDRKGKSKLVPRRKRRVMRIEDMGDYSELPTTSTPTQTPVVGGVRSLQSPPTHAHHTSGVRSFHIGSSTSPQVTPSPTQSPRDVHGRTSGVRVTPPLSHTPPYRMIPVPGVRMIPTPTPSPDAVPLSSGDDVLPDDEEGDDEDEEEIILQDKRVVIHVADGGYVKKFITLFH